ncbi:MULTISPECIES: ABC transporter ATP-binding protein [Ralstonia solanacearum species complex]|uniref:ABC transporter ATP-binding protein n=2 Tax=Ralstonia solanacearum species complex TaxID=3116862 RepID=A0A0S4VB99_RALSL|nr:MULTISPECIES: ABC transporter ATP-binding protein [Ralstonia]APF87031.1 ABC transporter ATP-binding protein [Ralstonia solanacearum FJAT-1458]AUS42476.1 ABC transporter ATP-binding protein [Ralstonia solanacearum]ASL74899.1 ABC transporter ATP-binding protein [Ralstonia pseudosolanacearum]AST86480.1 ABC transporter ATP-binding protein [Ralstonia pseudosolanacearum]AXW38390.1 ABC transporter ATP-binding protein [Ralstonia solanacearum]
MAATTPMLEVRGLHAYYGKSHILHGVDLHVGEGEIVALLGRNGVGRSTLAKSIMGMVRCEGHILLRGKDVRGLRTFEVAHRGIGYVPENRDIFPTLTVRQNLLLGEKRNPRQPRPRWQLDDMYRLFPRLKEREHTPAGVLSGGEQQMLTLCRTLMGDPDFVIIDEPTEGLAPLIVAQVGEYLKTLKARGISVLLVEQKLAIALDISQRVYVMGHGQIVFEGTPADLKADARVRQEWLEV